MSSNPVISVRTTWAVWMKVINTDKRDRSDADRWNNQLGVIYFNFLHDSSRICTLFIFWTLIDSGQQSKDLSYTRNAWKWHHKQGAKVGSMRRLIGSNTAKRMLHLHNIDINICVLLGARVTYYNFVSL